MNAIKTWNDYSLHRNPASYSDESAPYYELRIDGSSQGIEFDFYEDARDYVIGRNGIVDYRADRMIRVATFDVPVYDGQPYDPGFDFMDEDFGLEDLENAA